jgi:hypothetical protein
VRRALAICLAASVALAILAPAAQAAKPTLGPIQATDVQGVSALLVGTVDPEGQATTFRFEYGAQGPCGSNPCALTATTTTGADSETHPARAALSGLSPDTTYDFRLVAINASGTSEAAGSFTTTHGFGFLAGEEGFSARAIAEGGATANVAGTHPYQLELGLGLSEGGEAEGEPGIPVPDGNLRDLGITMPPGLLLNPRVIDRCKLAEFLTPRSSPFEESLSGESCPDRSQVGTIELSSSLSGGQPRSFGLFELTPPNGVAAQLAASPFGVPLVFALEIHTDAQGSYTLHLDASNVPQSLGITHLDVSLWGVPWGASHDDQRGNCLNETEPGFGRCKHSVGSPQSAGSAPLAFLTLPTSCQGPLSFAATADAWQQPAEATAAAQNREAGTPLDEEGCQSFSFAPATEGFLTDTHASSPSGFNFRLSNETPQLTNPEQQLPSQTRTATVTLPEGVTINPSLGAGLIGCTPAQYSQETAAGPEGTGCPNGSKIGDFTLHSPLFEELVQGAIYLAQPDDKETATPGAENPFDSLFAVYLVARSPERGILVKVAGELVPDPGTGQLTATFEDLPQLPYTDLNVNFRTGQRAPLITPDACGPAPTQIDLVPWAGPGKKHSSNASQISSGVGGGPCPGGAVAPFSPEVVTGGVNANVGSYTPYYVRLSRKDTEQELTGYSLVLPKGITGKIAGIPFCPDQDIEAKDPFCPVASQVGHIESGYGVGDALTYAPGRIYLAGPYHGAPLSVVAMNSAKVGPFDLGTIVVRSAFDIDPHTAQLQIDSRASDPIPHIVEGVPLHLRDIRIYMDRPQFAHNPSSCEASKLISTVRGSGASFATPADDSTATVERHFQLLNCLTLGFRPKLGIRLRGGVRRAAYPELRATFASRGAKDSNLKRIEVVMPHSEFLAQNHIREVCAPRAFEAEKCPADSVYGHAVAYTPLFDTPLRGDVYLRSSKQKAPDLVADLHSGAIRIVVEGKIGPAKGGIRAFFDNLPDAPIERFTMILDGGRRGLLQNSSNICAFPPLASVKALAQNNRGAIFNTTLRGQCAKHESSHKRRSR